MDKTRLYDHQISRLTWLEHNITLRQNLEFNLGLCFINTEREDEFRDAFCLFQRAAESGHVEAIFKLGGCYFQGRGVEPNIPMAMECFHQAAALGSHRAHRNLVVYYGTGDGGVEQSIERSMFHCQMAAILGNTDCQWQIASFLSQGLDFPWLSRQQDGSEDNEGSLVREYYNSADLLEKIKYWLELAVGRRKEYNRTISDLDRAFAIHNGDQQHLAAHYTLVRIEEKEKFYNKYRQTLVLDLASFMSEIRNWFEEVDCQIIDEREHQRDVYFELGVRYAWNNFDCEDARGTGPPPLPLPDDYVIPNLQEIDESTFFPPPTKEQVKCALYHFERAADLGHLVAQTNLVAHYGAGRGGVQIDYGKALKYCRLAAMGGHTESQFQLAMWLLNEVVADEYMNSPESIPKWIDATEAQRAEQLSRSIKWFKSAANANHSEALYVLGVIYSEGKYTNTDRAFAIECYKKAAAQNHTQAIFNLGYLLQSGFNGINNYQLIPSNDEEAVIYYKQAAEMGLAESQYNYAISIYKQVTDEEEEFERNRVNRIRTKSYQQEQRKQFQYKRDQAKQWLLRAREQGYLPSLVTLVELNRDMIMQSKESVDSERLHEESVALLLEAAEGGIVEAWQSLRQYYLDHRLVKERWDADRLVALQNIPFNDMPAISSLKPLDDSSYHNNCPICQADKLAFKLRNIARQSVLPQSTHVHDFIAVNDQNQLGKGGMGMVLRGYMKRTAAIPAMESNEDTDSDEDEIRPTTSVQRVALKRLLKPGENEKKQNGKVSITNLTTSPLKDSVETLRNEMFKMRLLSNSSFITKCYGHCYLNKQLYVVMELSPYGDLEQLLNDCILYHEFIPMWLRITWMRDIACALRDLHQYFMLHLDLKPKNILVFPGLKVKLTDFGLTKKDLGEMSKDSTGLLDAFHNVPNSEYGNSESSLTIPIGGTVGYRAPEIIVALCASTASDIFSFGMTCLHIAKDVKPNSNDWGNFVRQLSPLLESSGDIKLSEFIKNDCCVYELSKRVSATVCVEMLNKLLEDDYNVDIQDKVITIEKIEKRIIQG